MIEAANIILKIVTLIILILIFIIGGIRTFNRKAGWYEVCISISLVPCILWVSWQ